MAFKQFLLTLRALWPDHHCEPLSSRKTPGQGASQVEKVASQVVRHEGHLAAFWALLDILLRFDCQCTSAISAAPKCSGRRSGFSCSPATRSEEEESHL